MGKPVALLARAELRETRGFISITVIRPVSGLTANCTLLPPVSTPISRITAIVASRIRWYSLSVSVWAGATVMESPVCTPIASKFSMQQTITTLSCLSRITSISYSFQPRMLSSSITSFTGDILRPAETSASNSSLLYAIPPPAPPSVKLARQMHGNPNSSSASRASPSVLTRRDLGRSRPMFVIASRNSSRSSALLMTSRFAPIISTPHSSRTPSFSTAEGDVQAGLAAEGGQERVRPFAADDLGDVLGGEGFDVGPVGGPGVGHDRRRVAVDEDDLVPLLPQRLAGLGAGVVELAGLPDDDRAGADQ